MDTHSALANLTPEATIEEIITADQKAGDLLASIGMEPASHKSETLRSVCQQLKWSEEEVLAWVKKNRVARNTQEQKSKKSDKPDSGDDLTLWRNHIVEEYHPRLLSLLGQITHDFPRIHQVHGNQYTWLKHMQWPLEKFDDKLQFYTYFESQKFFPLFENLNDGRQGIMDGTIQKVKRGIGIIQEDQEELENLVGRIKRKGNQLNNPSGACSTLRILNYNLNQLFSILSEQFELERQKLLPLVRSKYR
ncbi:hypothetical protein [Halalkalibaculum sp. DA384]|uniref:hypothetical protein n=1 Tax=Halalkalibaculum sp. DA384 TaxID=3373606 RepID=UPI00375402AB